MKYLMSFLIVLLVSFSLVTGFTYVENASAGWIIFSKDTTKIPYCNKWDDCWIDEWIKAIEKIDTTNTKDSASVFIQKIVIYLLWFLQLIAVWIIIYSWVVLLTWVGDEEKAKKTKQIIMYTVFWLIIIWLAYPLTQFIFTVLNWGQ